MVEPYGPQYRSPSPLETHPYIPFQYVTFYDTSDDDNSQEAQISIISGAEQSSSSLSSPFPVAADLNNLQNSTPPQKGSQMDIRRGGGHVSEQRSPPKISRFKHGKVIVMRNFRQARRLWKRVCRGAGKRFHLGGTRDESVEAPDLSKDGLGDPFESWDKSKRGVRRELMEMSPSEGSPSLHSFVDESEDSEEMENDTDEGDNSRNRDENLNYGSSFFRRLMRANDGHLSNGYPPYDPHEDEGRDREMSWVDEYWGDYGEEMRGLESRERLGRGIRGGVDNLGVEGDAIEDGEEDGTEGDLEILETILQYQRSPNQFYLDILQAKLKCRSVEVHGALLSRAVGYPPIFQALLDFGVVDVTDGSVIAMVQDEINRILSGNPYEGNIIPSSELSFLRSLCRIPSSKVSVLQMVLLRYSGFSFIELLMDYPHLEENNEESACKGWKITLSRFFFFLYRFFNRISCISTFLLNPAILANCIYWIVIGYEYNGYWTTLTYFVGFMAGLITTIRSEKSKLHQYTRTANNIYYPDYYYAMFPIINIYKLVLWYRIIRYDRVPRKVQYVTIRHDLFRAHSIQQIAEASYSAIPQLILQTFLFSDFRIPVGTVGGAFYTILVIVASISILFGVGSYIGFAVYSHSCNSFGFAIPLLEDFYSEHPSSLGSTSFPSYITDVLTRIIHFLLLVLCVSLGVTSIIDLAESRLCGDQIVAAQTLSGLCFAISLLTLLLLVIVASTCRFRRIITLLALPPLAMYSIVLILSSPIFDESLDCWVRHFWFAPWHAISMAFFAFTALFFLVWSGLVGVEVWQQRRITQRSVDFCLWKWR